MMAAGIIELLQASCDGKSSGPDMVSMAPRPSPGIELAARHAGGAW